MMQNVKRRWSLAGLILALLLGAGTAALAASGNRRSRAQATPDDERPSASPPVPTPAESAYVHAQADFGARLFRAVASEQRDENVFLSPAGAFFALAMAYEGASAETRQAIGRTLGVGAASPDALGRSVQATLRDLSADSATTIAIASSLWAQQGAPILEGFTGQLRQYFGAEVASLDLTSNEAVSRINAWVSRGTRGKIEKMLNEPLTGQDVALLLNAVYFKGKWVDAFDSSATKPRPFHVAGGRAANRPAMTRTGRYAYARRSGFQVVRLPYRGQRFSMYVILPDSGRAITAAHGALSPSAMSGWLGELRDAHVRVVLPRFRIELETDLKAPLTALGMRVAFDPQRADFSGMLPRPYLARHNAFISRAWQKSFVEVNEEGTEAAAATGITMSVTSAPAQTIEFVVDRPFLVVLRDERSGVPLFMGQVVDPR
jgi:serine protease inhibitor